VGIENYYWIIDRAVVDPLLALSWPEFHRRYRWKGRRTQWRTAAEFLSEFDLDPESADLDPESADLDPESDDLDPESDDLDPESDDLELVHRILATRTLRWTMLRCSDLQYFFMLEVIDQVPEAKRRLSDVHAPLPGRKRTANCRCGSCIPRRQIGQSNPLGKHRPSRLSR
jgi:hypothetical protein